MPLKTISPAPEAQRILLHRADSGDLRQASFLKAAMSAAARDLPRQAIGVSWCAEATTRVHRLPKDDEWAYYIYSNVAGEKHKSDHLSYHNRLPEMHDFVRIENENIAVYMAALRTAFVDEAPEDLKPAGFILRPNSMIMFFDAPDDGIVILNPAIGGHDAFEEIEAIHHDFAGQFVIDLTDTQAA